MPTAIQYDNRHSSSNILLLLPSRLRIILIEDEIKQMVSADHMTDPPFADQELLTDSGNITFSDAGDIYFTAMLVVSLQ